MKIDRTKLKKGTSEVPVECKSLLDNIKQCAENRDQLLNELKQVKVWIFGKCELLHWADVLDIFDDVLEKACKRETEKQWLLPCDRPGNEKDKLLLLQVLQFTSLLIEHSFTRHLYNSMEHLTTLLCSSDMTVVLGVLNLLYVFSKRSNFIMRLNPEKKKGLVERLMHLAESWGGKENGFGLAECCCDLRISSYPLSSTTLHFEFYAEQIDDKSSTKHATNVLSSIHIENVDKVPRLAGQIMEDLVTANNIPLDKQILLFTHIRLAQSFSKYEKRLQCVQARLQAISVLVYSNAMQESLNVLLYNGFIEELVDILEVKNEKLMEIKAAALRTLTSIIHLERNPKLNSIIDATGASSYHGFLPVLVRTCIQHMTETDLEPFPQPFATALFSFLYHLASYEGGGEALVACGMMESLLKVVNWYVEGQEHITFVTRAVRVVDLITNLDMQAFQTHSGIAAFINRLENEVECCRKEQPYVIRPARSESLSSLDGQPMSPARSASSAASVPVAMETDTATPSTSASDMSIGTAASSSSSVSDQKVPTQPPPKPVSGKAPMCYPQRAALLKSMLNFLKKAIPDPAFSESIRHLMDGSLPRSLKHIISNAEYYGPSLFLLATDVVTVYIFQEPSLLSSLQDNGLTDVVLHALLVKDVPATREVLASLPNVFSALCLNARGLEAFVQCKPFDRLFKVLLSPDYLPAMRRRRSSDPPGDTASNLGSAMDELMRHQPSLRIEATKAIIKLLEEVCGMGKDSKYVCQKTQPKAEQLPANIPLRSGMNNEAASSDSEDEEDEVASTHSGTSAKPPEGQTTQEQIQPPSAQERIPIPLMDYVLNVMKFVEAILSNNTTDDHCREFVNQNGLDPLMSILGLPNLPVDFPASPSCQAVAAVCKSILTLSHDPNVLRRGLLNLNTVLDMLEPLHKFLEPPGGSVLLRELANAQSVTDPLLAPKATPLLHSLAAAHAYITMFTHVCKVGQSDIRSLSVSHWGAELGLKVLQGLSRLYTSLVWESTVLLAFCSEDILPQGCEFGKLDLEKIVPKDLKPEKDAKGGKQEDEITLKKSSGDLGSNGVSAAMESLSTSDVPMETDETSTSSSSSATSVAKKGKLSPVTQAQIKQIKLLLSTSSRLGRALAELFGLLVKLSVGSPVRQRRFQQLTPAPTAPTPAAKSVATALTKLLANGLSWVPPPCSPVPKLRLTFFICSVGFTSPMLFDEKKYPYHLMLQKFLSSGGQEALFEAFRWALSCGGEVPLEEGLEYPTLPDGTGEFLDAWLMLVEKMVNTKSVMESPHTLPAKATQPGFVPFHPLLYLIHTHKMAFSAVMYLWNKKPLKVYGGRMSESILAILCHIIKGEAVINEKSSKEKEKEDPAKPTPATPAAAASTAAPTPRHPTSRDEPEMYQENLQQLMDMGFSREHCAEALANTASLEQATEYCLTHPPPPTAVQTPSQAKEKKPEEPDDNEKQPEEPPLEKLVIDDFTESMFPGCMQLLDSLPETVYRVCDLITVVTGRNGDSWRDSILSGLLAEIAEHSLHLMDAMTPMSSTDTRTLEEWANHLSSMTETSKLAVRLHLLSLLFEEMKMPCAEMVEDSGLLELLVRLLNAVQQCLVTAKTATSPKWMTPLILLLDQYEKMAVASKRKAGLDVLTGKSRIWKWFDDRSGRWYNYSTSNNKTIDDAYQAGESNIRFTAGRKRYTVQFSTMIQINEDSHNRRPVMLSLPTKEEKEAEKKEEESSSDKTQKPPEGAEKVLNKLVQLAEKTMETDEDSSATEEESLTPAKVMKGLMPDQISSIIRSAVGLIEVPVDADSLHAVMRLTLRLTREHEFAVMFSELGGAKLLLNLTQASGFQGSTSLITLIFRHILEEPKSLMHTVEKVVRSATSGTGSSASGVAQGSMGSKELNYILRVLGPVACRCPEVFTEVAKSCLRIALPPPAKRDEDEARLTNPNTPQLLKCLPSKPVTLPPVEDHVRSMVCDLLNTLAVKYTPKETAGKDAEKKDEVQEAPDEIAEVAVDITEPPELQQQNNIGDGTGNDETSQQSQNAVTDSKETAESVEAKAKIEAAKEEAEKKRQPLLPKSAILRLLAELVRSYAACAQLVTQHNFQAGQTELVIEDCGVLAFILDNLLPQCQTAGDKDCPALARVLIACIASCNHNQDAQALLGCEIKGALQRALNLPESTGKHAKIQALTGIISIMIESCPAPGQVPNQVFKGQQSIMNNMVRVLLRKGLVNDLARIPHSLDLASPNMVNTINAALKPLETLSRIVNQPQSVTAKAGKLKTSQTQTAEAIVDEPVITEDGTRPGETPDGDAQAPGESEVRIQDVTGNEIEAAGLDETAPLEAVEPPMDSQASPEEELEEVLDQLLERDTGQNPENSVLGEILMESAQEPGRVEEDNEHAVVIDVEVDDADDDVDQHDSQMVTQDISDDDVEDVEDDTTQGEHEEEGGSEPDGDEDDDDNEDDEEGDDDDDDEEEEEEDEDEGSDMEADDDEYQDIYDEPFSQRQTTTGGGGADDDLYVQLEELLPTVPAVPPAPSNVTATHPLLIRHAEHQGITGAMAARVHRAGRQRGTYRFNPSTQTLHLHYTSGRHPNPPAILQRLLGPSAAADVLQLTNTLSAEGQAARLHFVTGENLRLVGDEVFEELFQDPFMDGDSSSSGVLASVPSALSRWTEEARVLDGDSMHDGVTVLKPEINAELEKHRDAELAVRKEKRKKTAEEEAAKKEKNGTTSKSEESKNKAGDPDKTIEWENAPGAMEVGDRLQTPSAISTTGASTSSAASTADGSTVLEVQSSSAPSTSGRDQADQLETLENTESLAEAMATAVIEEEWPSALQQHMQPVVELPSLLSTTNNGAPSGVPQVVQWSNEGFSEFPNSPPVVTSNITATTTVAETPAQAFSLLPPSAPLRQSGFMVAETPTIAGNMATIAESITPSIVQSYRGTIPNLTTEPPHNVESVPIATAPMETGSASSLSSNTAPRLTQDTLLSMTLTEALRSTSPTEDEGNDVQGLGSLMGESLRQFQASENPTDTVMPEQPSDITSSDAVTVHSSGSNSETPSVGDIGTPSGEPPVTPAEVLAATLAAATSSRLAESSQGTSANNARNVSSAFGEVGLPDGVDPSFLAALPDNIRQEVIGEQLRLQRIQERAQEQRHTAEQLGTTEVSADFLAALPPSIQEEVLAQQRSEQARLATTTSRENPEVPVDPAGFIQSLPPTLRQQVLADMDDSMVAVLPSELATEANTLRRELEDRHRRIMQDRLFFQGAGPLSALLRHSGLAGRLGSRYTLRPPHSRGMAYWNGGGIRSQTATNTNTVKLRGRYLLDHEALTCLLVLLFVDEPKLNSNRLHRVLRNLCYHAPTRTWVLRALLSMLHRTSECKVVEATEETSAGKSSDKLKRKCSSGSQGDSPSLPIQASSTGKLARTSSEVKHTQPSWLSISLDAALGCRASVFQIPRSGSGKKHANTSNTLVTIHPQASPVVCRHVLDTLISLAKSFPNHFLPHVKAKEVPACKADGKDKDLAEDKLKQKDGEKSVLTNSTRVEGQTEAKESCSHKASAQETDFWELLVRLDSISSGKKGKGFQKLHVPPSSESESLPSTFEGSPLGQLMTMLSHPVVRRSQLLTDRLLRLLGLVSTGLPDLAQQQQQQQNPVVTTAAAVTTTAATTAPTSTSANSSAASTSTTVSTTTTSSVVSAADQTASTTTSNIATAAVAAEQRTSAAPPADQTSISRSMAETTRQDETLGFSETMDISTVPDEHLTSTPLPGKKDEKTEEKKTKTDEEEAAVLEQQLQLAVEVLTSKSCSEEGLEDATNLLLQLSRANNATRDMILGLLLGGARHLGLTVCAHIRTLLCELQQLNSKLNIGKDEEQQDEALVVTNQPKGVMQDRFQGGSVVVHVGNKVKASGGRELRVPSMSVLTNKNASQQFLLRILKVIIQLRQAARLARLAAKKKSGPRENISSISAAMAMIEAETEAIMEMVGRRDRARHGQSQPTESERPPADAANSTSTEQQQDSSQAAATATTAEQQPPPSDDSPMEVDQQPGSSTSDDKKEEEAKKKEEEEEEEIVLPGLSDQLQLEELWEMLGECLTELAKTPDNHAVLVLQPTVEAFFLVHAGEKEDKKKEGGGQQREDQLSHLNADLLAPMSPASHQPADQQVSLISRENSMASVTSAGVSGVQLQPDTQKFLKFADTHRTVLNHILRQSTTPLADGPFAVLVDHTRVLDFDVKRRFFRQELDRMDEGTRRENLAVHVRREHVFEDSFRELHRRTADEWKHRLYIVFEGEEGQDAGGLLREWYLIMSREIFNPMYALFMTSPGDRVTYTINPQSHINSNHLSYYKFVGRFIAKAIYDNKLLECYFTRSFYKHMLGVLVKYMDMESEDYAFYQGLVFLLENDVSDLGYDLAFSTEVQEFGVTEIRDLKPNGRNLKVSEENKREYMKLVCQEKMTGAIRKQLNAFLEGFYDVIPKRLIAIFNEQELELLISGLPTIDIDDLKANTEYHKYQVNSLQVQWFWRALRSFDQADRARFLQFVTGTSKVPLQGFAHLEGMNGTQKFQIHRDDRSTDRLPSAHTCFNQLDLPAYETYDKLKHMLLTSCNECSEGFGLA